MITTAAFPALLESFFTHRLMQQRQASPHTIGSYRDTFRLLLQFAQRRLGRPPTRLDFEQIDAPLIAAFLDDLEKSRAQFFAISADPAPGGTAAPAALPQTPFLQLLLDALKNPPKSKHPSVSAVRG